MSAGSGEGESNIDSKLDFESDVSVDLDSNIYSGIDFSWSRVEADFYTDADWKSRYDSPSLLTPRLTLESPGQSRTYYWSSTAQRNVRAPVVLSSPT